MNPVLLDLPELIRTPRLLLRPPKPGDGAALNAAILDSYEELSKWMPWCQARPTLEESEDNVRRSYAKFILREDLRMTAFDRATGKTQIVGTGLHRLNWETRKFEIGYWVRSTHQGQGFVTESTNALTRFAFEFLKARRVEVRCDPLNERSAAIIKRLGFAFEGHFKNDCMDADGVTPRDTLIFARTSLDGLPELEVSW